MKHYSHENRLALKVMRKNVEKSSGEDFYLVILSYWAPFCLQRRWHRLCDYASNNNVFFEYAVNFIVVKILYHSLFMEYNYKFISPAIKVYCIQESEIHRHITALISLIEIKVNSQLPACEKLRNCLNLRFWDFSFSHFIPLR